METVRDHAALMDGIYRGQRHIYDVTRKYFLFGRDTLIEQLDGRRGDAVLEIGCGTGRNLARIGQRWPGTVLHGLDISAEMLQSAQKRLGTGARLAQGDATAFDGGRLFERNSFDRIALSFVTSMIPDWQQAVAQAIDLLAPGGALQIVDFGDLTGLPWPLRPLLSRWLAHFHVTPRATLADEAAQLAMSRGYRSQVQRGRLGYFTLVTVTRPVSPAI